MSTPAAETKPVDENWVGIQKRTFTKWCNNHLSKKGKPLIRDAELDWEDGLTLMNLINSLYNIPIPKFNKQPKLRAQKLDNIQLGFAMIEQATIKTNFLKAVHLVDHDLKMLLGMMWAIILDYAIKGISVDDLTAKEGLLLWVQKKTKGYRDVDPPSVQNFSKDWRNGLALCALIHKHRPDLLNYDELSKDNAESNIELAFSLAENALGIPRLLEVSDLTTEKPDERSVMTYVSEFFHRFSAQGQKELAARRAQKFLAFARELAAMQHDYQQRAAHLLEWVHSSIDEFDQRALGETLEEAIQQNAELRQFVTSTSPEREGEKLDLEALFAEIQTQLRVNNRSAYHPPHEVAPESIDAAFEKLHVAEKSYAQRLRENRFRFIKKVEHHVSEEQLAEYREAFDHFDLDKDNSLNIVEFKAAAAAVNIAFRDDAEAQHAYDAVAKGSSGIALDNFVEWMIESSKDKDTPDQVIESFRALAGADTAHASQLEQWLSKDDLAFVSQHFPQADDGGYDYHSFITNNYGH